MKDNRNPLVVCLCPGDKVHCGKFSDIGVKQMLALESKINVITREEYNTTAINRLVISFSFSVLAWNAFGILHHKPFDTFVSKDVDFLHEIKGNILKEKVERAFNDTLVLASHFNAPVVVILANSVLISKFAAVAYKHVTGSMIALEDAVPGIGFCIVPSIQKIIKLSFSQSVDITPA